MLYSLQIEIIETDDVDFLTLFVGDSDDTILDNKRKNA